MNSFAALQLDSDDEDTKVTKKTTVESKGTAKKGPAPRIPGAPPSKKGGKQPAIAAAVVSELVATDPSYDRKVNDRGGKSNERYGRESRGRSAGKGDPNKKHQYDKTGKGKEHRGGRGPGNWGSQEEEARAAAKNPAAALENATAAPAEATEEVEEVVEAGPTVFGLDEMEARREAARANSELFGAVKERAVVADKTLKVAKKDELDSVFLAKESESKVNKKQPKAAKATVAVAFTVAPAAETEPRAPRENRDRYSGRGARGNRDSGRDGRGARGGAKSELRADDFPAL